MAQRVIRYPDEGFEGLIFDLDGTLIDSMPAHFNAIILVAAINLYRINALD